MTSLDAQWLEFDKVCERECEYVERDAFTFNKHAPCKECGNPFTRSITDQQLRAADEGANSFIECVNGHQIKC